jgi:hypothetical protein
LRLHVVFLLAVIAIIPAVTGAQECKKCDCYHFPIPDSCGKCCAFASGTISSVTDKSLALSPDRPSDEKVRVFDLGPTVRNRDTLKKGAQATVFYHPDKERSIATRVDVLDTLQGLLVPANEPDPSNPCPFPIPRASFKVFLGSSVGFTSKPPLIALTMKGEDVLVMRRVERGMAVSAKVLSPDGRVVAQLVDNRFFINPDNFFKVERPDEHSLIVYGRDGEKALDVRFLNPTSVRVLGAFHYPGAHSVIVEPDTIHIGRGTMTSSCFGESHYGISIDR